MKALKTIGEMSVAESRFRAKGAEEGDEDDIAYVFLLEAMAMMQLRDSLRPHINYERKDVYIACGVIIHAL